MECPRTGSLMEDASIGSIKVGISIGCGAIWFDNFEIQKFDEPCESVGEDLIKATEKYYKELNTSSRLNCPMCNDVVMTKHFFSVSRQVEIDECPQCGGVWLDPGELHAIRRIFESDEEKEAAADEYFETLFQSPEMLAMKASSEENLKRAKRFAGMFKYLCPSQYVPSKQDWGAF